MQKDVTENQELSELKSIQENQLVKFDEWEKKQKEIVASNPFIEVVDSDTHKEAKKRRTALKTARTDVEKQDRTIGSVFSSIRKRIKEKSSLLVDIVSPHEKKQQEEVEKYEKVLADKKAEKARKEQERIDGHTSKIESLKEFILQKNNELTCENHSDINKEIEVEIDKYDALDFEEYQVVYDNAKESLIEDFMQKKKQVFEEKEKEAQLLKEKQRAKFNEVKLNAIEKIGNATTEDMNLVNEIVDDVSSVGMSYDFGDLRPEFESLIEELRNKSSQKLKSLTEQKKKDDEIEALKQKEEDRKKKEQKDKEVIQEIESVLKTAQSDLNDVLFNISIEEGIQASKNSVSNAIEKIESLEFDFLERKPEFDSIVSDFKEKSSLRLKSLEKEIEKEKELEEFRHQKAKEEAEKVLQRIKEDAEKRIQWLEKRGFQKTTDSLGVDIWENKTIRHDYSIEFIEDTKEEAWKNQMNLISKDIEGNIASQERKERLFSDKNKMDELIEKFNLSFPESPGKVQFENEESEELWKEIDASFHQWYLSVNKKINNF